MKRWIRRILVYLFVGAIINVAVAWGCAWWVPIHQWDLKAEGATSPDANGWYVLDSATLGRRYTTALPVAWSKNEAWDGNLNRSLSPKGLDGLPKGLLPAAPPQAGQLTEHQYIAAGFPCLAMSGFADRGPDGTVNSHGSLVPRYEYWQDVTGLSRFNLANGTLPLVPLWDGTIINTLTYAFVVFLAMAFVRLVRRKACERLWRTLAACIVICLVFGGITTVVVAWACAYYVFAWSTNASSSGSGWTVHEDPATGSAWAHMTWLDIKPGARNFNSSFRRLGDGEKRNSSHGPAARLLPTWTDYLEPEIGVATQRGADARGWPMVAMWTAIDFGWGDDGTGADLDVPEIYHAIMLPRYDREGELKIVLSRLLPLAPIWPGFLLDTLFYSVTWTLLLFVCVGPRPWRRAIRRRRGQCLDCGYDLQGLLDAGCPECGWHRPPLPGAGAESLP